jgi:hypothetical protein
MTNANLQEALYRVLGLRGPSAEQALNHIFLPRDTVAEGVYYAYRYVGNRLQTQFMSGLMVRIGRLLYNPVKPLRVVLVDRFRYVGRRAYFSRVGDVPL